MRVMMVLNRFYPMIGGAEAQCKILSHALYRQYNIKVDVVTYRYDKNLKTTDSIDGLNINRISDANYAFLLFYFELFFFLLKNRRCFDLIHCHSISVTAFVSCLAGKLLNKPCVVKHTIKNEIYNIYSSKGLKGFLKKKLMNFTLRNSTVITLTTEGENELLAHNITNYRLIPNGVDKKTLAKHVSCANDLKDKKFGFLGRFCEQKGIDILLNAFEKSLPENSTLEIMGSAEHQDLSNLVALLEQKKKSLGNRLIVSPPKNPPYDFYKNINIYVSASKFEGLPNTVLEALALDKTCIISDIEPHRVLKLNNPNADIYLFDSLEKLSDLLKVVEPKTNTNSLDDVYLIENTADTYAALYKELLRA